MTQADERVRLRLPSALPLGVIGTVVLTLASFTGGSIRNRGGLLESLNLSFLAYGHGRNIGMVLFWLGMFLLVAAWVLAAKQVVAPHLSQTSGVDNGDGSFSKIRRMMWLWVAPLVIAAPLASRDIYSYLMQGAMTRDGFDPYSEGAAVNPGPFLLEVSQDWRNTTTPYGPLHLWMGEIVTRVVGDNVTLGVLFYKAISLVGFAAMAWAVPKIAQELGGSRTLALWLGVANPVLILHLVGGMHNESIMVGLVSIGLWLSLRRRFISGLALIGVSVSLKATAFIAVPFVVWLIVQRYAPRSSSSIAKQIGVFLAAGLAVVVETIAVVAAVTWASGSSWGWLSEITGNSKVINPLAAPTLVTDVFAPLFTIFDTEITYNSILSFLRSVSMVLMLLGLATVWWIFRQSRRQAIYGTFTAYQVAFVFNSVTLPWYYASVISLVGTVNPPRWLIKFATGASIFVALAFAGDGNHQLYNWWWVIGVSVGAWFTVDWIFGKLPKQP